MPNLSASMPTKGWPMPQTRFWMAIASAKTSRPQPYSVDIGVRKKPMVERGPKPIAPMAQPATRTTGTERQKARDAGRVAEVIVVRSFEDKIR